MGTGWGWGSFRGAGHLAYLLLRYGWLCFQMLALMQHQMILLEERLSTFTNMGAHRAAAVWMSSIVLHEAVLGSESLAAAGTEMRFRLVGRRHGDHMLLLLLLDVLQMLLSVDGHCGHGCDNGLRMGRIGGLHQRGL